MEIHTEEFKSITDVSEKYTALHFECKIGVLAVKLVRDAILKMLHYKCAPRRLKELQALPQAKCTIFDQFLQFWACTEEYVKTWVIAQEAIVHTCISDCDIHRCSYIIHILSFFDLDMLLFIHS